MDLSNLKKNPFVKYVWQLVSGIVRHDITSLAAVITFYAFFSLFPFLLLIIFSTTTLVPHFDIQKVLTKSVVQPFFPTGDAEQIIETHVADLANVGRQVGLFSALTLTWSAMSGFLAVQQAMDVIWEREHQRSFIARRIISFVMVMIMLVIMLLSALITTLYPWLHGLFSAHATPLGWITLLHGWSRILFPVSLFISFIIFYRYLPSKRAAWEWVIPGAFVATILLDLGRNLFVWYANHLVHYHMIYGTLTAVMLIVLWLYVGSTLMLFGAEVSAALEGTFATSADGED